MDESKSIKDSQENSESQLLYNLERDVRNLQDLLDVDYSAFANLDNMTLERARFQANCDARVSTVLSIRARIHSAQITMERLRHIKQKRSAIKTQSELSSSVMKEGAVTTDCCDENVTDVTGCDVMQVSAGRAVNSEQGQRSLLDMGDYLSRPIEIYSSALTMGANINLRLAVWDLFTKEPSVRAKLRNYAYLRGNLRVRISVSGTPFHYGRLLVSYQPYYLANETLTQYTAALVINDNMRQCNLNYLSQAPGSALIDVSKNEPLEIECPFISTKPMHRLFNTTSGAAIGAATSFDDMVDAGALYIFSINPVLTVTAGASLVYIQVYAWIDDAELGTSTATQIAITTESKLDERIVGPIESIASRAYTVANALSAVPFLGVYAKASAMAFGAIRGISAIFGWSKPDAIGKPVRVRNDGFQNGALTIGFDTTKRVVLDPRQELTVDPRVVGDTEDCMTIHHLASRVTYYDTFTWTSDDIPFTVPTWLTAVTPSLTTFYSNGILTTWSQPTALGYAVTPFTFWRGDIKIRLEIVCSAFHRGKLAIGYEPNCAQNIIIDAALSLNKQFIKVIDIQETQVVDLVIPWASYRSWLKVWPANDAYASQSAAFLASDGPGSANGYIFVFPFTALQSPNDSDVHVNVYVSCDNLQVNGLSTVNMPTGRAIYTESYVDTPIQTESCLMSCDISTLVLNDSSATTVGICEDHFGEQPLSFRALLKRFMGSQSVASTNSGSNYGSVQIKHQILPINNLPYNDTSLANPLDLFSYLRYGFLGIRGGIRFRSRNAQSSLPTNSLWYKYCLEPPATTFDNSSSLGSTLVLATPEGGVTFVIATNAGVEVEFPYYSNNLFQICFNDDYESMVTEDNMEDLWFRNARLHFDTYNSSSGYMFALERAAAEDFSLLRFQGAPFHSGGIVS